jgi:hypothetical protein
MHRESLSAWGSACRLTLVRPRFAPTATTDIIRTRARHMVITDRAGLPAESLSVRGHGSTGMRSSVGLDSGRSLEAASLGGQGSDPSPVAGPGLSGDLVLPGAALEAVQVDAGQSAAISEEAAFMEAVGFTAVLASTVAGAGSPRG